MPRAIFLLLILATQSIVAGGQAEEKASSDRPPPAPQFALKDLEVRPVTIIVGRQGRLEGRIDGVTDLEECAVACAFAQRNRRDSTRSHQLPQFGGAGR